MIGKFRIWDDTIKKYTNKAKFLIDSNGDIFEYHHDLLSVYDNIIIEYSAGHKDSTSQEWYVNDWTILDDYCIGVLVYDDEMSCFGFNIYEGISIDNYDDSVVEFEPLYYYNVDEMIIEGNIHERIDNN